MRLVASLGVACSGLLLMFVLPEALVIPYNKREVHQLVTKRVALAKTMPSTQCIYPHKTDF